MLIETTKHMHLQAITTKYLSLGNVRGARIKATVAAGSLILKYQSCRRGAGQPRCGGLRAGE